MSTIIQLRLMIIMLCDQENIDSFFDISVEKLKTILTYAFEKVTFYCLITELTLIPNNQSLNMNYNCQGITSKIMP